MNPLHDDDTLVAYLDGQLDDAQCAQIEAELPRDPVLRERLDALARASELAQRSLEPVLREPLPPELIAAIWRAPDPRAATARARRLRWRLPAWPARAWPTALASLLLVAGLGSWLLRPVGLAAGDVLPEGALALALDTAASGETLRTRQGPLTLLGSFVAADGRACRAFVQGQGAQDTLAIACRDSAAEAWRIGFAHSAPVDAAAGGPAYQPASDPRAEAADAYLRDELRATALDAGEERGFIERGWDR